MNGVAPSVLNWMKQSQYCHAGFPPAFGVAYVVCWKLLFAPIGWSSIIILIAWSKVKELSESHI